MPGSSEIATGQYSAVNAAIGGIDLNRSLADYRVNPRQALSPGNIGNAAAADADRQRFAMDIFARLIVAAGIPATDATANPGVPSVTVTIFAAPLTAQYNVLRSLAQLSANIVDYIDSDDISTRFVWNAAAGAVGDSTVFGVEKPRLVLSEVYSELTNDPNGPDATFGARVGLPLAQPNATSAAHVRFWLELQNPTSTAYVGGTGPLGSGAVNVRYTAADGAAIPYSVYTVEIVQDQKVPGNSVADYLRNPLNANNPAANVTGSSNAVSPPALIFDFSTADAMAQRTVSPANGNPAGGMVICAANVPMPPGTKTLNPEFNPAFPNVINGTAPGMAGSLTYTVPLVNAQAGNQQHVVMLRRLANPYLIESPTNPYITVDTITNVRTADRLLRTNGSNTDRPALPTAGGFESDSAPVAPVQDQRPQSTGKVQPYAAWAVAGTAVAPPRFPQSLVLFQDPAAPANGIRHTFGRQNSKAAAAGGATYIPANPAAPTDASLLGNESLMAPYDWLVHLDRPLINPTELLHVSYGKPHELTLQFITPNGTPQNAGADINKFSGSLQTVALTNTIPQLYRALDLLRIQPYGNMTAAGGRLPGRINLNTIQDKRVWDALFDAQIGNGFTQADVDTMWTGLMQSRTLNLNNRTDATGAVNSCPIPGSSVYDTNTNAGDRPFLPFGVANVPAVAPGPPPPPFYAGGSGIGDTVLRGINPATGLPWILTNNGTHPYQKAEALRKIWNNTTTVSHSFAVWVTVGYFEVESETPSPIALPAGGNAVFVRLGKEYYDKVPGDMRHKFFAIVDRSNVTLQPIMPPAGVNPHFASRPFFTTLEGTAAAGTNTLQIATAGGMTGPQPGKVYSDNVELTFGGGSQLVVGIGANQEVVTIDPNVAMGYTAGYGITTVTLTSPLVKHHAPGESVSNARPGNPGPQPGFDVNKDMYKPVVPHWSRIKINE